MVVLEERRGLRKGDALSPFLFVIIRDCFSRTMIEASDRGIIKDLNVGRCPLESTTSFLLMIPPSILNWMNMVLKGNKVECQPQQI